MQLLRNPSRRPALPSFQLAASLSSMAFFFCGGRFRELLRKYDKVAIGVHFSVSATSITGLYVAIKNNVDVESLLEKLHMDGFSSKDQPQAVGEIAVHRRLLSVIDHCEQGSA